MNLDDNKIIDYDDDEDDDEDNDDDDDEDDVEEDDDDVDGDDADNDDDYDDDDDIHPSNDIKFCKIVIIKITWCYTKLNVFKSNSIMKKVC